MRTAKSKKDVTSVLTRGVRDVVVPREVEKQLLGDKPLRVKHGVDPTTPDLHLGYAAVYEKLRILQEWGHTIVFLIGDFTGRFGDPTDKSHPRALRTKKEVRALAKNYIAQAGKILDTSRLEVRYNGEWYDAMKPEEFLRIFSHFTVQRMLERDMFQKRIQEGLDIRLHEPLYPALQAYDSVMIKSNLTVIGHDQLFNELQARKLQEDFGQAPQGIIAVPMLVGTDGKKKMSQSLGNYIGISEPSGEQYGKIMSIPDSLIYSYFELLTRVGDGELGVLEKEIKAHPRDTKARLAREIVTLYHGAAAARKAEEEFDRVFRKHQLPQAIREIPHQEGRYPLRDIMAKTGVASSKSEAGRLIQQKAVKVDGVIMRDIHDDIFIKNGTVLQAGKRHIIRFRTKK